MSKQSSILRPTLVLGLITLVVSALLVLTYNITGVGVAGPAISEEMLAAAPEVLPGGEGFEDAEVGASATVPAVLKTSNDAGYVINALGKGYGGDMSVLIGFDNDGKITGVVVLDSAETPGIGTKVTEDAAFLATLVGKTEVSDSDAVAGASFSSKGLREAITNAIDALNTIKAGGQLEGGAAAPSTSENKPAEKPAAEDTHAAAAEVTFEDVLAGAKEVVADAEDFEEMTIEANDNLDYVLKATNDAGYAVNVKAQGFGGDVNLVIGFDADKNITGVTVLASQETQGIGSMALEADVLNTLVGKPELDEEIAVSGASVTSGAINEAVKTAIEAVKGVDA